MKKYAVKILPLMLSIVLVCSCVVFCHAEETEIKYNPANKRVELYYHRSGVDATGKHEFVYSDKYFSGDARVYNNDFACFTLGMALTAFNAAEANSAVYDQLEPSNTIRATNLEKAYDTLGFTNRAYYNFHVSMDDASDKVAFSNALKYVADENGQVNTIVSIMIRGGYYGAEWASNMRVFSGANEGQNHYGWQTSANEVYEETSKYIENLINNNMLKGDLKIWISGYSRGAAVANLTSHMFNHPKRTDVLNGLLKSENLYSYSFATPRGAYLSNPAIDEKDRNIWSIVSPSDFVARVAPQQWNYRHYGNTLELPDELTFRVLCDYKKLHNGSDYQEYIPCSPEQSATMDMIESKLASNDIKYLYKNSLQNVAANILAKMYGKESGSQGTASVDTANLLKALGNMLKGYIGIDIGSIYQGIIGAHTPEHYLAWLQNYDISTYTGPAGDDTETDTDVYATDSDDILTDTEAQSDEIKTDTEAKRDSDSENIKFVYGDVTSNGEVSMLDVTAYQRVLADLTDFTYYSLISQAASDVNRDEKNDMKDVVLIQKYLVGLVDRLGTTDTSK